MQTNPLKVLLTDMYQAGVRDVVAEEPFDFFEGKIVNPFDNFEAENLPVKNQPSASANPTIEKPLSKKEEPFSKNVIKPTRQTAVENTTPQLRNSSELIWQFGADNPKIQVIMSSDAQIGMHPLSVQGKALFEKILKSIQLQENDIGYVVLNRADKFSATEKAGVVKKLKDLNEVSFKLFVGEEAVKCTFDQTLIRARQQDMQFENKPCGLLIHPESLMTQPLLKKLAWQDLLKFQSMMKGAVS